MASPEAALIAALTTNAGVSALAGSRVFIWGGQQGATYPHVTIQRIATAGAQYLTGPTTLEWPLFQLDCWATTALESLAVAEAIRSAIDNVTIAGSPTITAVFQNQGPAAPDEPTRTFGVMQEYHVYYSR